ncbi:hypothetical protein LMG9673_04612 [Ralstonia pseudosolanacearum]|nr:hypothetical protein LMG9673_04612 [Ralstonia pseudosolanacearum]
MVWLARFSVALPVAAICPPALLKLPLAPDAVRFRSAPAAVPDARPAKIVPFRLSRVPAATLSACRPSTVPPWLLKALSAVTLTAWPPISPELTTAVPCTVVVAPPRVPVFVIVVPVTPSAFDAVTVPALVTAPPFSVAEPVLIVPAVAIPCVPVTLNVPLTWLVLPTLPSDTAAPLNVALPPTSGSAAMDSAFAALATKLPAAWLLPVRAMSRPALNTESPTLAVRPCPVMSCVAETPSLPRAATWPSSAAFPWVAFRVVSPADWVAPVTATLVPTSETWPPCAMTLPVALVVPAAD